ncbi:type I methionyl aminopeptidase [Desulfovibrio litoralis]|uniref:Methionine aminopeptidase n=1 Tax=Desulfovibrio litoralis DSM 11393 TaxID=1121455 RepID=A0A1M7SDT0_9BACT|nr:type I methionyl aminopeptidase [Desulfovibrio litoralis]SHN56625.1 methionine aminopeptidase, type I [Desulfovibrio litoralis DSM 11393]
MKKYRGIFLKNEKEIAIMHEANKIVSNILDIFEKEVRPGVETMLFEEIAQDECLSNGVKPAFQGYCGYPYAICCSVNEQVVHGFPSNRTLLEGDIVSFDMGVVLNGFFADSARTFTVGEVKPEVEKLVAVTKEALWKGIKKAVVGNSLSDISQAVQEHSEQNGYAVIRRFVGHGIGVALHEKPEIPNFVSRGMVDVPLQSGMVLAIEPMLAMGTHEVEILSDKWTAVTKDGKYSAHFEHSVAVTPNGPLVLSHWAKNQL